jgi:hypothetical protein
MFLQRAVLLLVRSAVMYFVKDLQLLILGLLKLIASTKAIDF